MELAALNQLIVSNVRKPYYIFVGQETTIRDVYISQISKRYNLTKVTINSVLQALKTRENNLFGGANLYVVKEDKDFLNNDELITRLKSYNGDNVIIVCYETIDKRKSNYKLIEEETVWFNQLENEKLYPYIKKVVPNASEQFYEDVVYVCQNNYGRILLELDKSKTYAAVTKKTIDQAFYDLLASGVIILPPDDEAFTFANAFLAGDSERVFGMLNEFDKTDSIRLLSLLYTIIRQHFLVLSYRGNGKITDETGLQYFIVKKIQDSKKYFTVEELEYGMNLVLETIQKIKQGKIEAEYALDYVILKMNLHQ